MTSRGRILILWNQTEDDIYETWRDQGPRTLDWDPNKVVPDVGTVQEEMEEFIDAVKAAGFETRVINVQDDLDTLMAAIRLYEPDAVFNLIEFFNEDASLESYVAGIYELMGVSFTGNPPQTLQTCQNKFRTKLLLDAYGLPTSPFELFHNVSEVNETLELNYPLIVKPGMEDASGGISADSVVHNIDQLKEQVAKVVGDYEMPALVEEYIEGREIHAAILGNRNPEVLPLFEMEFDDSKFNPDGEWRPQIISFRAKWDPHSKDFYKMDAVCPAMDLPPWAEDRIRQVALGAFKVLGCRDYARIDMRVDNEDQEVYILEVNPNPDLVNGAAYMMCASASGRSYPDTLGAICEMAVKRGKEDGDEAEAAELPSDELLREWVKTKRPGETAEARSVPGRQHPELSQESVPATAGAASNQSTPVPTRSFSEQASKATTEPESVPVSPLEEPAIIETRSE